MALGGAAVGDHKDWRGAITYIKEASKDFEIIRDDPIKLRDFVQLLTKTKKEYSASQEVQRELLTQTERLRTSSCLSPHLFDHALDLTPEPVDSSTTHYDNANEVGPLDHASYYLKVGLYGSGGNNYTSPPTNPTRVNSSAPQLKPLEKVNNYADTDAYSEEQAPVIDYPCPSPSVPIQESTSTPISEEANRNWSEEFWKALERPFNNAEESLERSQMIKQIADEFCEVATRHGKTIISEAFMPVGLTRTIPPISAGGLAGGLKYAKDGIFFKFAVDNNRIYGGDHHQAMKAAGHELKGLCAYMNCQLPGLLVPLMALIDYRGFRLIATSELPIAGESTLVYGSCDGGVEVHCRDATMSSLMQQAGAILNLKGHYSGSRKSAFIYGPCDLEGHATKENGMYVIIDTARTFPPEKPIGGQQGVHLTRLLRPELVRSNKVPLSSDSFTSFGANDSSQDVHNKEVEQAQQRLLCEIIPNFVLAMNQRVKRIMQANPPSLLELEDQLMLVESMHREGINVRYLPALKRTDVHGLERPFTTIINTEILARRAKNRLRAYLRDNVAKGAGSGPAFTLEEKVGLANFFNTILVAAELQAPDLDGLSIPLLINRITSMTGIALAEGVSERVGSRGPLISASDFAEITPRVRCIHTVSYQEGVALYHQAISTPRSSQDANALLLVAEEKFRSALNTHNDPAILTHWGMLLTERARLIARSHDTLGTPEETRPLREKILAEAVEKFKSAVKIKRNHHYALFNWSEALREWAATISPELVLEREALLAQADAKMREAGVFQKKWFFGTLPTNGAAGLLAHHPAHAFFIRNSNSRPGNFVFSHLTRDRKIKHTLILYTPNGNYTLARNTARTYGTLEDFVIAKSNEGYIPIVKKWWD